MGIIMDMNSLIGGVGGVGERAATGLTASVMDLSKAESVSFDSGKQWRVIRQFRSGDKVFGQRESVCAFIPLVIDAARLAELIGFIKGIDSSLPDDKAGLIAMKMASALQLVQHEIFKGRSVDVENKSINEMVNIADFSLAGIADYLEDNGATVGGGFTVDSDMVSELFNQSVGEVIISMLMEKGVDDTNKIAAMLSQYHDFAQAIISKKVLSRDILESVDKILTTAMDTREEPELVNKGEIIAALKARIVKRLKKIEEEEKRVELI